jgi:hypothetical protein
MVPPPSQATSPRPAAVKASCKSTTSPRSRSNPPLLLTRPTLDASSMAPLRRRDPETGSMWTVVELTARDKREANTLVSPRGNTVGVIRNSTLLRVGKVECPIWNVRICRLSDSLIYLSDLFATFSGNTKCEVNQSQTCGGFTDNTMFQGVYLV